MGVTALGMSHNGMHLVTAGVDGSVVFWNLLTGSKVNQVEVDGGSQVRGITFSPDD